jgi:chromosomal replication initiation ATPase DnaA
MLWRVLDLARTQGGAVLLVASAPPASWPVAIPDLRSRLNALAVARLGEPDEALMEVVLHRICREQFIQLSDDAARYLARRLPRTFAAAHRLAAALDADLTRGARPVSRKAAEKALEKARADWVSGDG